MMNNQIILFKEKKNCCACGACYSICPSRAISFYDDEYGFTYPKINQKLCIQCQSCKRVCAFQTVAESNTPLQVFAMARKDTERIQESSSGGAFAVFAEAVLRKHGVVYGVSLVKDNATLNAKHIRITQVSDLKKILGSKYVQSQIGDTFKLVQKDLKSGKLVLFSGTPCQVAGLKSFLGKHYNNLLLIDIVCHGVPNQHFFQGYIKILEKKFQGEVIDFIFRDKIYGWGLTACAMIQMNKLKKMPIDVDDSSYYHMFLYSNNYRDNCYSCKYTNNHRPGDITIGDYWGVEEEQPEILKENGGSLDTKRGISLLIVNSSIGNSWIQRCRNNMILYTSSFNMVAKYNTQLREPSIRGKYWYTIMQLYKEGGYQKVNSFYYQNVLFPLLVKKYVKRMIPNPIKNILKTLLRR